MGYLGNDLRSNTALREKVTMVLPAPPGKKLNYPKYQGLRGSIWASYRYHPVALVLSLVLDMVAEVVKLTRADTRVLTTGLAFLPDLELGSRT